MALSDLPDVLGLENGHQNGSGETSNMTGVGDQSPSLSQTLAQDMPAMMTQSMCIPPGTPLTAAPDIMTSSTSSLQGLRKSSNLRSRAESAAREREREERVRRLREGQEDERRRKLDELKQHAQNAQKFRELQETERRKHIDQLRSKDMDRRAQVEERRRDIEKVEQERREAILARNKERESRLETQRRSSRGNIEFAFGSSAPRLVEPRVDSASGYWGSRRSTSSNNVGSSSSGQYERRSAEREAPELRAKRTASAQGLDRSNEGDCDGLIPGTPSSAHRRRTDLVPTLTMRREDREAALNTPRRSPGRAVSMSRLEQLARPRPLLRAPHEGAAPYSSMQHLAPPPPNMGQGGGGARGATYRLATNTTGGRARAKTVGAPKQGLSRENSSSRPGSALSSTRAPASGGVRLRPGSAGGRRQRPLSIATTGMTASMYEERQRPQGLASSVHRSKGPASTPKPDRMKRARSVTSDTGGIEDDNRSTTSSQSVGPSSRTPGRRTPSQVKADNAARKAKVPPVSTPKSSLGARKENGERAGEKKEEGGEAEANKSKSASPAGSQDLAVESSVAATESGRRQSTPDILKDNNKRPSDATEEQENIKEQESKEATPDGEEVPNNEEVKEKKMITSEEEAKARIAEKRREMKEQKEREAEVERLRLEEEERQEEEQRRREEEEMRQMELLAEEGRRAEEERIEKAIQEREEEERRLKEEEERLRKDKEETEKKTKEEAEKREAELQEKLKKEEEERLARKKRIEEIMARTRGKGAAQQPPKEEAAPLPSPPQQPASLDPPGDPTKPDLLGDISEKVEAENARNLSQTQCSSPAEPEVEKGALDSLSLKSEDTENSSPLITLENGAVNNKQKSNGVVEGGSFDQILDLGDLGDSNKEERAQGMPSPIRAFEENNSQQNGNGALGVRDLLS